MSTQTITTQYKFRPGIMRETTQYAAEGGWYDGNRVRFRDGKPENIRGWQKKLATSFIGTSRDIMSWVNNDGDRYLGFGTQHKLYVFQGGITSDITPCITSTSSANLTFTSGSTRVLVSAAGHGTTQDSYVYVVSATSIANIKLSGDYKVSVVNSNSFTVSATTTATQTSTTTNAANIKFLLTSGAFIATTQYGYGVGVYGRNGYNEAASVSDVTQGLRQWSLDHFGENLLSNYAPTGKLYQWVENNGTSTRSVLVTAAPTITDHVIVSPLDRHALCLGCNDLNGTFDPLLVRWSNQEDLTNWTPSVSSTAGSIRLGSGTKIMGAVPSRNLILVFTDKSLHGLRFIGPPFIFQTSQIGDNCGLIAKHAVADFDGAVFWMGQGNFFTNKGGGVSVLPCTVRKKIFDNFNYNADEKVFCGVNQEFGEVTWLYPSENSTECDLYVSYSPSQNYWTYGESIWTSWLDRTTYDNIVTTGVSSASATTDSFLYDNEPFGVYTADGGKMGSFIESGNFDLGDGDNMMFIDRLIPDFVIDSGSLELVLKTQHFPNATTVSKGPFTVTASTPYVHPRTRGRQGTLRIQTSIVGAQWQFGTFRMDIVQDGKR